MRIFLMCATFFLIAASCQVLKYSDDTQFLNSAQAGSYEFFARIDGSPCMDMDGVMGMCAKRIKNDQRMIITQDARPYSYKMQLECSSSTGIDIEVHVEKDSLWRYEISSDKFYGLKSFTCIGKIYPDDRPQEISAKWLVKVGVIDAPYREREVIYKNDKGYLVMGAYAYHVYSNGEWSKKKTAVKIKDGNGFAYSESYRLRYNYYGI